MTQTPSSPPATVSPSPLSARALTARLKQRCPQPAGAMLNFYLRVHRGVSWLQQSEDCSVDMADARFLFAWIALNSLYAKWNPQLNLPATDHGARKEFLSRLCNHDCHEQIHQLLRSLRPQIKRLFENPYLSETFWRDPAHPKAKGWGMQDDKHLDTHLKHREVFALLEQIMSRLSVLRGQLVHGASTSKSKLNRGTLTTSQQLLEKLVPQFILLMIDRHCDDTWPEVCYPPQA